MRSAILADIHSNIVALEAVLSFLERHGGFDRLWVLGDTVGYGPRPKECIDLLREHDHLAVAGNHDLGAIGRTSLAVFNAEAALCCRWSGTQLEERHRAYLAGLPLVATEGDFTLVHGSLRDPIWEYLVHEEAANASFQRLSTRYLLVGHSHLPLHYRETEGGVSLDSPGPENPFTLGEERAILNPGSVGQPRDGDPRAACALYDTEKGTFRSYRVEYDTYSVQQEMQRLGLPERMGVRLNFGW
ncbi:MAG: metallophosphoesterase family protein [Chloroflexi bacterium]|nr:metallophosphoesterase family protein [Chloroflexota bacterium]